MSPLGVHDSKRGKTASSMRDVTRDPINQLSNMQALKRRIRDFVLRAQRVGALSLLVPSILHAHVLLDANPLDDTATCGASTPSYSTGKLLDRGTYRTGLQVRIETRRM